MHTIEPFYNWRHLYKSEQDIYSPFYGRSYDLFNFSQTIYNFIIHPYWDNIGSETLYIKILFCDYQKHFAIIEMFGEWNDTLHNDIMHLKRNVIDEMLCQGIKYFILIGENVLNFHSSDDCYYEEWWNEIEDENGWILLLNFREHVLSEMKDARLHYYLFWSEMLNHAQWRKKTPDILFQVINEYLMHHKFLDDKNQS